MTVKYKVLILCSILLLFGVSLNKLYYNHLQVALIKPKVIYRVHTLDKVVALTFDDGPDPRFTLPILDILKEFNAPSTFFIVGNNAKAHPDIVKRIVQDGHELANHTMTHPALAERSPDKTYNELEQCLQTISAATGRRPSYFRPPKGLTTVYVDKATTSLGMQEVLWTVCIENRSAPTPREMADRVLSKVQPGTIILLHDGRLNRTKTVQALPMLLEGLEKNGYQVIPLRKMLEIEQNDLDTLVGSLP